MSDIIDSELDPEIEQELKRLLPQLHSLEKFKKKYDKLLKQIKSLIPNEPNRRYQVEDTEITVKEEFRQGYTVEPKTMIKKTLKQNVAEI